jgi:hypothetical protein
VTTERAALACVVGSLASLAVLSCGSPANQGTVYIDTSRIPPELHDDYASFAVNCSKCHSLSRPLNASVTEPHHWNLYVARMMRTAGSAISPREVPAILRFLHWYTLNYRAQGDDSAQAPAATDPALSAPDSAAPTAPSTPSDSATPPEPAAPSALPSETPEAAPSSTGAPTESSPNVMEEAQ